MLLLLEYRIEDNFIMFYRFIAVKVCRNILIFKNRPPDSFFYYYFELLSDDKYFASTVCLKSHKLFIISISHL